MNTNAGCPAPSYKSEAFAFKVRGDFSHSANPNKITNTYTNLIAIKRTRNGPPAQKIIPKCMVINARSFAKPQSASALDVELSTWEIDVCFVCETWLWLNYKISSNLVCPSNYFIVRKDRGDVRNGGGIAIICREDWKCKLLNFKIIWNAFGAKLGQQIANTTSPLYIIPRTTYSGKRTTKSFVRKYRANSSMGVECHDYHCRRCQPTKG